MANEKRLIGYDPIAFGEFTQSLKNTLEVYDPYSDGYEDGVDRIEDWLEFNFVEAIPVVHGEWLDGSAIHNGKKVYDSIDCSVCEEIFKIESHDREYWKARFKVCPFCGAVMDGERKNNG
jgi:hypothetical protein